MIATLLGLIVTLAPYHGPALIGSVPGTAKFSVAVRGSSGEAVHLAAVDVPKGYVASFCTDRVCAPFHVTLSLPASGVQEIELQYIQNDAVSSNPQIVRVAADGGARASIRFARAAH